MRRSARRTVGLTVSREGLRVTAPQRMALRDVQAALQQKAHWILTKLDTVAARPAAPAARAFETGELLPYRGGTLTLVVVDAAESGRATVVRTGDELRVRAETAAGAAEQAVRRCASSGSETTVCTHSSEAVGLGAGAYSLSVALCTK